MQTTFGQKIAWLFAIAFYLAGVGCALALVWYRGAPVSDALKASLLACVIFCASAGFVLQVIGSARLKGLLSLGGEPPRT